MENPHLLDDGAQDLDTDGTDLDAGQTDLDTDDADDLAGLPPGVSDAWQQRLEALRGREKGLEDLQKKAAFVDRLTQDPAFARQVLQRMAGAGAANDPTPDGDATATAGAAMPQSVLDAVQAAIGDDQHLQFLVPALAKAAWAVAQQTIAPLQADREKQHSQARQDEYGRMTDQLSQENPGWEAYENEMHSRLQFLQSALAGKGPMTHPKYGSVLKLLYTWSSGEKTAVGEASRRMRRAITNKTTTGSSGPTPGPSTADLIAQAGSQQDKWRIAFQAGLREATGQR